MKNNIKAALEHVRSGYSINEAARIFDVPRTTLQQHVKKADKLDFSKIKFLPSGEQWYEKIGQLKMDDGRCMEFSNLPERVLCFSCSQAPFQRRETVPFLSMVIADTKPNLVVMLGDLVDMKFAKKAFAHPDDLSPAQEIEDAREFVGALGRIIPNAIMLTSNHAEGRVYQMQQTGNVPSAFLRRWQDVFGVPEGWVTRDYLIMRNWLFEHGDGVSKGSRTGVREEMVRRFGRSLSVMRGHRHNLFGEVIAPFWETRTQQVKLCYVGCTMDDKQASYTKSGLFNGCVLLNRGAVECIPMETDAYGSWTGRLVPW